jgi:hypothetical protein
VDAHELHREFEQVRARLRAARDVDATELRLGRVDAELVVLRLRLRRGLLGSPRGKDSLTR